ncbi:tetratricopeptide repeat protein [Ideonella azotifigens]|uniref:tetratricopeptide repeat protein n=1 Tax=Ideonella azotifigens TaxID=513160 RepID=UPI001142C8F8|nr:tetratricopeptide repeat protein [Ideonella azotifigens]
MVTAAAEQELARSRARRPLIAAVMASLFLGLAVSLWFFQRSQQALTLAQQQTERAQAINDFLNKDLLQSADISERGARLSLSVPELLQKASARASARFKGQDAVEASVRMQLGQMNLNISAFPQAEAEFQRAWTLLEASQAKEEGMLARLALARTLTRDSKFDEARRWLEEAERDAGPQAAQGSTEVALQLARTRFTLLSFTHETKAALPFGEQALALQEQLHPGDLADRAGLRRDLGDGYYRANRYDRAKELLTVVLKPPFSPESIGTVAFERARLALVNASMSDADADADHVLSDLGLVRDRIAAVLGPDEYTVNTARISMAGVLSVMGRFEEARKESQATYDSLLRTMGADHQATRISAMNLAVTNLRTGHARQALAMLDELRAWAVQTFQHEDHAMVSGIDFYRGQALNELGRPALALPILEALKADAIAQTAPAADWAFKLQGEQGRALALLGRPAEASPLLEAALAGMKANGTADWFQAPLQQALLRAGSRKPVPRRPENPAVTALSG